MRHNSDENQDVAQAARIRSLELVLAAMRQLDDRPDLSLLLSVEAYRMDSSYDTQDALLRALQSRSWLIQRLHGPRSDVNQVAYSRDGKTVAVACGSRHSGNNGNVVYLWDATTGRLLAALQGHQKPVRTVEFSWNSALLASGDADGTVVLWDVADLSRLATFAAHDRPVHSLAFSPDGTLLAAGGIAGFDIEGTADKGGLRLWNVMTHEPHGEMLTGHTSAITSLAFAPDGKTLASGSGGTIHWYSKADYTVILWNIADRTQTVLPSLPNANHHGDRSIRSLAFHPDGTLLVAGTAGDPVVMWDVAKQELLAVPSLYNRTHASILNVQFSSDGSHLYIADASNRVTVAKYEVYINPLKNEQTVVYRELRSYGEEHAVQSAVFSRDGKLLVAGGCGQSSANGACSEGEVGIWAAAPHHGVATSLSGKFQFATGLAFSPDGKLLAASIGDNPNNNNDICVWNLETGQTVGNRIPSARARSLIFGPDGKWLASGENNTIRVVDTVHHNPIVPPLVYDSLVVDFAFTPVEMLFAVARQEEILVRDLTGRRAFGLPLARPGIYVRCLAFSPDGKLLVAGSCNREGEQSGPYRWQLNGCLEGAVTFWDVEAGEMSGLPLAAHTSAVTAVAFSADGKILATASDDFDGTILLWDVATRLQIGRPLAGHNGAIEQLYFRPDGQTLVSIAKFQGRGPDSLILWEVATQRPIGRPLETRQIGMDMTMSADGKRVASCGMEGTILLWDLDPTDWIVRAGRIVNRNLTQAEWERYFGEEPYRKTFAELP